ncbi:type VI secretion system tip protein VgrG [Acinetobacter sp. C_4_1]|uniref:type VI secretion system Vgr family protein n=1 Tax=unclassified Acinetobacter TaxID=196816 RepID=UPI0021B74156|nr:MULTISPECIES: type VI secretion system Vgr family protein [unclassified Acinetobacter]MCT8089367.1 type VI secretion system tip protein VgrG [Acinetobacter sp. F_3_1]MCT8096610.1 type VI secretion system tip protein VgrG [Acinetobacter sp. C_3_1]MCT8101002.1 type VI secretion system tip protein VgrG [Acinetobacter sp. C_4_1]MCT8134683.1 type VI secretion system tip protein VgrG [Acinetobacter sp. T_3_1]
MLKNIHMLMDSMGLSLQKRALHIQFSNELLNAQVFIQRIEGQHRINQGLKAELMCLSTHAHIALKQFIGGQVAVDQVTDTGELSRMTGVITAASQGQSDGALTLYQLTLEDATALWHKRRNSRVFINKSVRDISEILFKEWQGKSRLFAASLSLNMQGLSRDYDVRPFVMQANETDYEFLTRLWRSEGINWLIDEAEHVVASSATAIQAQKLRLIDEKHEFNALKRTSVRFHRSHATEAFDSITGFIAERSLQSTAVQVQRWQAQTLSQDQSHSLLSHHQHSELQDNETLSLEQVWSMSPAWTADLTGADQATTAGSQQLEKLNRQLSQYQDLQAKYFTAQSSVRDAHVGYWFELLDHPEIDRHSGSDKEFLILGKSFYNQNNLPKDIHRQVDSLVSLSRWQPSGEERQGNELYLVRRNIAVLPEYHPLNHRPVAYPQRARVVGPEGESIYVDQWGRIKVRFMFTRSEDHAHDGGAGSNDNDTDSAWVDVLTPWAGEGYGARFHPRIGEIVVIDFFEGDVDRPFVVGRIHEAERHQSMFDRKGQLPDTKKLSGIRSQEVDGNGFNQLRFDDTTGQISTQLQSSHGASQLNLGHLSHPKAAETSEGRGEGFELRTDQWGAVRAGEGLLISTHKQDTATGHHLDVNQAKRQLENSFNYSKSLSDVAKNQQTDSLTVLDNLKHFLEQMEHRDEAKANAFKQALMILAAPNSIACVSNQDLHLSADGQISQTARDAINFSTQKSFISHAQDKISLFAAQQGVRAYAAKGKVELQAQDDAIEAIARKVVKLISTEDRIELISPQEIVLTAGGSQLKINAEGIFTTTGGKFESKAGQHSFVGGDKVPTPQVSLPMLETPYSNQIDYIWNRPSMGEKEIFIVDKSEGKLIKSIKNELDINKNMSSFRFYTPQQAEFTALGFNSLNTYLSQDISNDNGDELIEETEEEILEDDEVYTEEDFD